MVDVAIEFELAVRRIRNCYRDYTVIIKSIEEIISAVRTYCYVRCVEASSVICVCRIVRSLEDKTLICPVAKIIDGSRPGYIITGTEIVAVEQVM